MATSQNHSGFTAGAESTRLAVTCPSDARCGPMSTLERIETLSVQIVEDHCNAKNFNTTATSHMAPSFRAKYDGLPAARSRTQHLDKLKRHLKAMPGFQIRILNLSSEVDENRGLGTVYMFTRLSKLMQDLERESMAILQWERRHGEWLCVKLTGLRGPSGFPDT